MGEMRFFAGRCFTLEDLFFFFFFSISLKTAAETQTPSLSLLCLLDSWEARNPPWRVCSIPGCLGPSVPGGLDPSLYRAGQRPSKCPQVPCEGQVWWSCSFTCRVPARPLGTLSRGIPVSNTRSIGIFLTLARPGGQQPARRAGLENAPCKP